MPIHFYFLNQDLGICGLKLFLNLFNSSGVKCLIISLRVTQQLSDLQLDILDIFSDICLYNFFLSFKSIFAL